MTGGKKYKRVGVITNPTKKRAKEGANRLVEVLLSKGVSVFVDEETLELLQEDMRDKVKFVERLRLPELVDVIVVLGGDGTFLNVARFVDKSPVPLLGINLGKLGFLTEATFDEIEQSVEKLLYGFYRLENRPVLSAKYRRRDGHSFIYRCVNDVVIKKEVLSRIIEIELMANGEFLSNYRGDGVIVSTPTGSTAYSLSAGGPIVFPTLNAIIITPICPHKLTMRPLILSGQSLLHVFLKEEAESVMAVFDGQEGVEMRMGDRLEISRSPYDLLILRDPERSYFKILREKLGWG